MEKQIFSIFDLFGHVYIILTITHQNHYYTFVNWSYSIVTAPKCTTKMVLALRSHAI